MSTPDTPGATSERPRCHCGVYVDCHTRITDHQPRKASRLRLWFRDHDLAQHVVAPIWVRLPEKWRWEIVHHLNRSRRLCWSSLVDAALTRREDDACDVHTPLGCEAGRCATTCGWIGGRKRGDHFGEHMCSCYCGKFQFTAPIGGDERSEATR